MRKIIAFLVILTSVSSSSFAQEAYRRWRIMNEIRNDKFDLVLPAVMRENNIDMWIITNKEGNFDPLYPDMGSGYTTQNGYYIFPDTGKPRI